MNTYFQQLALVSGVLLLTSIAAIANTIVGPRFVCTGPCYTYSITGLEPDELGWEVTNEDGESVAFILSDDGLSIEVCFEEVGSYTISVGNDVPRVSVIAGEFTEASLEIVEPSACSPLVAEQQACFELCQGLRVVFRIREFTPDQMEWSFWGDGEVISETNQSIEIQFFDQAGSATIGYFGSVGDNCFFEGGQCIILIEKPEAGFTANGIEGQDTIKLCQGQSVVFESTSLAEEIFWFGDGLGSGEGSVLKTEGLSPGSYELTQIVSAGCQCTDSKSIFVEVSASEGASIYCTSSACAGDTVRYSSDPDCAPYTWIIEGNADIIDGGSEEDDFVVVSWNSGPAGTVSLTNGCSEECPFPTIEPIYVIGEGATISGPEYICVGQPYRYRVDPFDGTIISWTVSSGGTIISGQNSHQVSAVFNGNTPAFVAVNIEDCSRGCQHTDTLWLEIAQPYQIAGPSSLCPGDDGIWTATSASDEILSTWQVLDEDGQVVFESNTPSATFTFTPEVGGRYTVTGYATNTEGLCNSEASLPLMVFRSLSEPLGISGTDKVCPGVNYLYSIEGDADPTVLYEWEAVIDGTVSLFYGNTISVRWSDSNDQSLHLRIIDPLTGCESNALLMDIALLEDLEWTPQAEVCRFEEVIYTINNDDEGIIEWEVSPSELGVILDFPAANQVRIKWQDGGDAVLTARYCGVTVSETIHIRPAFEPETNSPGVLCGDQAFELTTLESYSSYEWYLDGSLISTEESFEAGHGSYTLIVSDDFGCQGHSHFRIQRGKMPDLEIQTSSSSGFCAGDTVVINNLSPALPGYTYTWYLDGNPISNDVDMIFATEFGEYQLEVLDPTTGCRFVSNTLLTCEVCSNRFCESCPCIDSEVDPCDSEADIISVSITRQSQCNEFRFEIDNDNVIPILTNWYIFEGDGVQQVLGLSTNVVYQSSGRKKVCVNSAQTNMAGDTLKMCLVCFTVEVEGVADFDQFIYCADEEVEFFDASSLIDGAVIDSYDWNFGDSASGASNTSTDADPTHLFSTPGTYNVSMDINLASGCQLTRLNSIIIPELPSAEFSVPSSICTDQPVETSADFSPALYQWYFGTGPTASDLNDINQNGTFRYDEVGSFEIELVVTDYRGCSASQTRTIDVNTFEDDVSISGAAFPACEGDWIELAVTDGPYDYIWNDGSTASTVEANASGLWSVTLTDINGCGFSPDPVSAEYIAAPQASILAGVIGGAGVFSGDTLMICLGTAVQVWALGPEDNRSYLWNTGDDQKVLRFDGSELQLLEVGIHEFEVQVTDMVSSCEATSPVFYIQVFSVPDRPIIQTDPSEPLCSGDEILLSISNVQPELSYLWSNGQVGTEVNTAIAGQYHVLAINDHSCSSESESVIIRPTPDVAFAPRGCQQACEEGLVCLPLPEGYSITGWMLDGEDLEVPTDPANIIISQSGTYTAQIMNSAGCERTTPGITFDIFEEEANLTGIVFFDTDNDGELNVPPDSLLVGFKVYLLSGGAIIDSSLTDSQGEYSFEDLSEGDYVVAIGESVLPDNWIIFRDSSEVQMVACDSNRTAQPLILTICPEEEQTLTISICPGEQIEIGGVWVDTDTTFTVENVIDNCVITEHYIISLHAPVDTQYVQLMPCIGQTTEWQGQIFDSDTLVTVTLTDVNGCDSVIVADIAFSEDHREILEISFCPGDTFMFREVEIIMDTIFTYVAPGTGSECDTLFEINAVQFADWSIDLQVESQPCPGASDGSINLILSDIGIESIDVVFINAEEVTTNDLIEDLAAGIHIVEAISQNGCLRMASIDIEAIEPLVVDIPEVLVPCSGPGVNIETVIASGDDGMVSFVWEDGSTDSGLAIVQPGDYSLTITNQCETLEMIATARPEIADESISVYIPNAFTPNHDEINDTFMPLFPPQVEILEYNFEIFDRWGSRLFDTDDHSVGWDGQFKDQRPTLNVYVWKLQAIVMYCGEVQVVKEAGDVVILKQ